MPMIVGGLLNLVSAAWINWFNAILFGILFLLELFLMPETLYPRSMMLTLMPTAAAAATPNLENGYKQPTRTKTLPFLNISPVPALRTPRLTTTLTRFLYTFTLPTISLAVLGYGFLWYWWVLSVITMIPAAYPQYSPLIQGLLFLGLLAGTVVSEVCCSGRLSDYIVKRLARQNGGVRVAEMRLWLVYPAALVTAGTFILTLFFFFLFFFFLLLYRFDFKMIGMANLLCLPA